MKIKTFAFSRIGSEGAEAEVRSYGGAIRSRAYPCAREKSQQGQTAHNSEEAGQEARKICTRERISVRVKDVNGPRGGLCRIKVVLSDLPSVVFEAQDDVRG